MEKLNQNKEVSKTEESHNILDDKSIILDEKTGTVTLPEKNLANLREALAYTREQEKVIISKLRESNEYLVNEIKEMLEAAFQGGYHSDNNRPKEKRPGEKSAVCDDYNYESTKQYYIDGPIKFLSEYEGNLQNFMDLVAEELKDRESGRGDSLYVMCNRSGISVEDFKKMDTNSIIEMVKKDIKKIPRLNPSSCVNNMNEHLGAASFYLSAIRGACEKLGYKI